MQFSTFSEFTLRSPSFLTGERCWNAHFRLDQDFTGLFPYIQAEVEGAIHFDNPQHIQFRIDAIFCDLYPPCRVVARFFFDRNEALNFVNRLMRFLNDIASRRSEIKPLYQTYRRLHVPEILRLVPLTNCGACGFPTCMAFAGAVSRRKTDLQACPHLPQPMGVRMIYPALDKDNKPAGKVEVDMDWTSMQRLAGKEPAEDSQKTPEKPPRGKWPRRPGIAGEREGILFSLSGRETEVLRLLAEGFTNKEIAEILSITHHTVKSHVVHIFNKLGVGDRTQAAVWAAQNELI